VPASGGFSHNKALRERFFPIAAGFVSATVSAGTGDGLRLAMGVGASLGTKVADPAYWVPASLFKRADGSCALFPHTVTDRAKPGVIAVNSSGKRFVNEVLSYHEFVQAMLRDGNDAAGRSFYLICDHAFLWSYGLGRIQPFTRRWRRYVETGELIEAPSIGKLAAALGVEALALVSTVENFNVHARGGLDPEFGRGGTIYQCQLGDGSHSPKPLRRLDRTRAILCAARPFGRPRHRDRSEDRCQRKGSARGWDRDRRSLRLRQRHGLDHERELSGTRHHARAGPDLRLRRQPAPGSKPLSSAGLLFCGRSKPGIL
jgi:hypothetical protein